ncbi:MAG: hypothetical protein WEF86_12185 [Gemmatimonadota bacterium]
MRKISTGLVILVCCAAIPASGSAQQAASPGSFDMPETSEADLRADEMHDRATALQSDARTFAAAARLHMRVANLRDASDPRAVQSLSLATALFWHSGRLGDAAAAADAAAARALGIGDVFTAANRNVDRAVIAAGLGDREGARSACQRAHLLSLSPHLTTAQREHIRGRIR